MSRRPSARFEQRTATPEIIGDARYERVQQMHAARFEELERIRELFQSAPHRELYSVEVAGAILPDSERIDEHTINRIASRLQSLQRNGVLDSRVEPAKTSGLGRRYYRLRVQP